MGPTATILLSQPLSSEQLLEIESLINLISSEITISTSQYCEFYVTDTIPIGGDFITSGCPFGIGIINPDEPEYEIDPAELPAIEACCGFILCQRLQFDANCNSKDEQRILGLLVMYFAEKFNGMVDFHGAVIPQSVEIDFGVTEWSEIATQVDVWLKEFPGKVCPIEYETVSDRRWVHHIADVEFFQAWLKHPEFHMIK